MIDNYSVTIDKDDISGLIKRAYTGDINARQTILLIYISKIDEKAIELYNSSAYSSLYTLDDIKQSMYLDMWRFINRFFNKKNKDISFLNRFDGYLNKICRNINNKINNSNDNDFAEINNVSYSNSYFVESIESSDMLDIISTFLTDRVGTALKYFRQGYINKEVAELMQVSNTRVGEMKNKIKQIVKENNLRR